MKQCKVVPIHPDYSFSNVELMLLAGKMGLDQTNKVFRHLLIADHLGPKGTFFILRLFTLAVYVNKTRHGPL